MKPEKGFYEIKVRLWCVCVYVCVSHHFTELLFSLTRNPTTAFSNSPSTSTSPPPQFSITANCTWRMWRVRYFICFRRLLSSPSPLITSLMEMIVEEEERWRSFSGIIAIFQQLLRDYSFESIRYFCSRAVFSSYYPYRWYRRSRRSLPISFSQFFITLDKFWIAENAMSSGLRRNSSDS